MMQGLSTCNPHDSIHGAHMIVSSGQTVSQTNRCPHSWYMTTNLQYSTSSAGVPYICLCRSQFQSEHYSMRLKRWRWPLEPFSKCMFELQLHLKLESFFQELESVFKELESIFQRKRRFLAKSSEFVSTYIYYSPKRCRNLLADLPVSSGTVLWFVAEMWCSTWMCVIFKDT